MLNFAIHNAYILHSLLNIRSRLFRCYSTAWSVGMLDLLKLCGSNGFRPVLMGECRGVFTGTPTSTARCTSVIVGVYRGTLIRSMLEDVRAAATGYAPWGSRLEFEETLS